MVAVLALAVDAIRLRQLPHRAVGHACILASQMVSVASETSAYILFVSTASGHVS